MGCCGSTAVDIDIKATTTFTSPTLLLVAAPIPTSDQLAEEAKLDAAGDEARAALRLRSLHPTDDAYDHVIDSSATTSRQRRKGVTLDLADNPFATPAGDPMNELWQSPETGAGVFVGNEEAAVDSDLLATNNIGLIIVCARGTTGKQHHVGDSRFQYLKFHVTDWQRALAERVVEDIDIAEARGYDLRVSANGSFEEEVLQKLGGDEEVVFKWATQSTAEAYFHPVFAAVDTAICAGKSVFIHCHAGAHRAGTVGIAVVMRLSATPPAKYAPFKETLDAARVKRPILDPDVVALGKRVHLLKLLEGKAESAVASPVTHDHVVAVL
jgi:hypothetical protein